MRTFDDIMMIIAVIILIVGATALCVCGAIHDMKIENAGNCPPHNQPVDRYNGGFGLGVGINPMNGQVGVGLGTGPINVVNVISF